LAYNYPGVYRLWSDEMTKIQETNLKPRGRFR